MFKMNFRKTGAQIKSISVNNSNFSSFIEEFTENTYIMAVFSDESICTFLPKIISFY